MVHFKNMADGKFSVHPHGLFYLKDSEGALYTDETKDADKEDDHVPRNGSHVYTWKITDTHAPADGDDNCLTWIYHSHVLPHKDIKSGLIGKIDQNLTLFDITPILVGTLYYATLPCASLRGAAQLHVAPRQTTPRYATLHYTMLQYPTPRHAMSRHTTCAPHHTTPRNTTPQYTTPHNTTLRQAMPDVLSSCCYMTTNGSITNLHFWGTPQDFARFSFNFSGIY